MEEGVEGNGPRILFYVTAQVPFGEEWVDLEAERRAMKTSHGAGQMQTVSDNEPPMGWAGEPGRSSSAGEATSVGAISAGPSEEGMGARPGPTIWWECWERWAQAHVHTQVHMQNSTMMSLRDHDFASST